MNQLLIAILAMTRRGQLEGCSDQHLVRTVTNIAAATGTRLPSKALSGVAALDQSLPIRVIDALRWLAESTALTYPQGLLQHQRNWAILRYLGLFSGPQPWHELSHLGRQIRGNHRRVVSEDLGIGFGLLVADEWVRSAMPNAIVSAVDIDVPLGRGYQVVNGHRVRIAQRGSRRPDYLLVVMDPSRPTRISYRVVECKGTASPSYVSGQLASAVGQLDGVSIGGAVPDGLAVSTFTGSAPWRFAAIDPAEDEQREFELTQRTLAEVEQRTEFEAQSSTETALNIEDQEVFAAAALASVFAGLAQLSGNDEARVRFTPNRLRESQFREVASDRRVLETPLGLARGRTSELALGDQHVEVFQGVLSSVDDALTAGETGQILSTQLVEAAGVDDYMHSQTNDLDFADEIREVGTWSISRSGVVVGMRGVNRTLDRLRG